MMLQNTCLQAPNLWMKAYIQPDLLALRRHAATADREWKSVPTSRLLQRNKRPANQKQDPTLQRGDLVLDLLQLSKRLQAALGCQGTVSRPPRLPTR